MSKLDEKLAKATRLRDAGQLNDSLIILNELLSEFPQEKAVLLVAGHFNWDYGSISDAVSIFSKAVDLYPNSKLCSLGFFHTLWKLEMWNEALQEAQRFQRIKNCEEYNQLIEDLKTAMNS